MVIRILAGGGSTRWNKRCSHNQSEQSHHGLPHTFFDVCFGLPFPCFVILLILFDLSLYFVIERPMLFVLSFLLMILLLFFWHRQHGHLRRTSMLKVSEPCCRGVVEMIRTQRFVFILLRMCSSTGVHLLGVWNSASTKKIR